MTSVNEAMISQPILKKSMSKLDALTLDWINLPQTVVAMTKSAFMGLCLAVFVGCMLSWLTALSGVDLSFANPFASLSHMVMLLVFWRLLHESPSLTRIAGTMGGRSADLAHLERVNNPVIGVPTSQAKGGTKLWTSGIH